jgi:hypothetical protein
MSFVIYIGGTTTFNNNGVTSPTIYTLQSQINYRITTWTTMPSTIIGGVLQLIDDGTNTLNMGAANITVGQFNNNIPSARLTASTSLITCTSFISPLTGTFIYNNLTLLNSLGNYGSIDLSGAGSFTVNTFTMQGVYNSYIPINDDTTITATNYNLLAGGDPSNAMQITDSATGSLNPIIARTGGAFPVYIQGYLSSDPTFYPNSGISYITFSPANTFFSVQQDYNYSSNVVANIRPSPSPMMMV